MDGTAALANREIGSVLPANYRRVSFSGAVDHLNRAATARYFGQLAGESLETRTRWRMMQSAANHSPRSSSLLNRELTGNFGVFGLKMSPGEIEKSRFYKGFFRKFPTQRNREF